MHSLVSIRHGCRRRSHSSASLLSSPDTRSLLRRRASLLAGLATLVLASRRLSLPSRCVLAVICVLHRLKPHAPLPRLSQGTYIDKKCPFTGNVSIRGRILKGIVVSTKMARTIVIRRDYLQYIRKYRRYEKRHKTVPAHVSPAFLVKDGDVVTVGQCRPLSKTVRFNVLKVETATEAGAMRAKKTFRVF